MKVKHIVFLKFNNATKASEVEICMHKLAKLKEELSGMETFSWGKYHSNEGLNQGFSHAFEMLFSDVAARDAYLIHPEHVAVANLISQYLQKEHDKPQVIAFDYCIQ